MCCEKKCFFNMMNVMPEYMQYQCPAVYDGTGDSYCLLVAYDDFKKNLSVYLDYAIQKRNGFYKYYLRKRLHL